MPNKISSQVAVVDVVEAVEAVEEVEVSSVLAALFISISWRYRFPSLSLISGIHFSADLFGGCVMG